MSDEEKQAASQSRMETEPPQELSGPDFINNLNNKCLARIFQYLPIADKLRINTVCKRWKEVSPLAWANVEELDFFKDEGEPSDYDQLPKEYMTVQWLKVILKRCGPYLKELHLDDSELMPIVGKYCVNLTVLDIWDADPDDWDWSGLFPQMENFSLGYSKKGGEFFTEKILRTLPAQSLTYFRLRAFFNEPQNDVSDMFGIPIDNRPVTRANLGCFSPAAVKLFDNFINLEIINISNCILNSDMMNAINQKTHLKYLALPDCSANPGLLSANVLTNLETLILDFVHQVNDSFLVQLSDCAQNLKTLSINRCGVTDKAVRQLSKLPQLEVLNVSGIMYLTDEPLGGLKNLKKLDCDFGFTIGDKGLITLIRNAPNLELLKVSFTSTTKMLVMEANEITKQRTNGVTLKIIGEEDLREDWNENNDSPFLIVEDTPDCLN
ncbi:uncharacterized protein LOC107043095 [Diachasma alloeum]|uniref:uncharacterized protein LOC107043095 n=1 Tax=Diachasma alloeum TaxID=454923 RepID=UPI00073829EC|nr:uncharacterized protein LOC107043095 [Diachasma alloeum]